MTSTLTRIPTLTTTWQSLILVGLQTDSGWTTPNMPSTQLPCGQCTFMMLQLQFTMKNTERLVLEVSQIKLL